MTSKNGHKGDNDISIALWKEIGEEVDNDMVAALELSDRGWQYDDGHG